MCTYWQKSVQFSGENLCTLFYHLQEARGIEIGEARGEARGIEIGENRGIEKSIKKLAESYMKQDSALSEDEAMDMAREILQ